jgi:hypothetical protein
MLSIISLVPVTGLFKEVNGLSASSLFYPADKNFCLMDCHVRVADQCSQVVDDVSGHNPLVAPGPWHSDMVDDFARDRERTDSRCDQSLGSDRGARSRDGSLSIVAPPKEAIVVQ